MDLKAEVLGGAELREALADLAKQYPQAAAKAAYAEGLAIQAVAQDMCPVDEGLLEKSAYTSPPDDEGVVTVGFGTAYAVYQHEKTELRHPKKGEAKFLEKAVNRRASGMLQRMAARIAELVKVRK